MSIVRGIDTGSWRVRVATLEGNFGRWTMKDVVEMDARVGMAEAVRAIASEERNWATAERVASLPLEAASVRLVKLPFTDKATIARALPAEVEAHVPYDLEDMVLATRVIESRSGQSRSLAITVPRSEMSARIDALQEADAEPRSLCLDAEALASYADRGVQAVIDIGHKRTVVALCQGRHLVAARLVGGGGEAVTAALVQALRVSPADAESWKHRAALPPSAAELADAERTDGTGTALGAHRAMLATVDEWANDIRAVLIGLEDELAVGVDELLLAGGGSQLSGLLERLASVTGVPARMVQVPGGHPPSFALAVALARAGAGEVRMVELREGEFGYQGRADRIWNAVLLGGVAVGFALVAGTAWFAVSLQRLWEEESRVDEQIVATVQGLLPDVDPARLSDSATALALVQERVLETQKRVDALGASVGGLPPTLEMLKTLSDGVPPASEARIDVRELNISDAAVSFRADTDSYEMAAKIEEALKKEPRFSQAQRGDEKKVGEILTFSMTIPLGEPQAGEPGAAGSEG